jgi:hypothetical protein
MPYWIAQLCDGLTSRWISATPMDYGRASLLIVALGWILSRRWTA